MKNQARGTSYMNFHRTVPAAFCVLLVILGAVAACDAEAQARSKRQADLGACDHLYYYNGDSRVNILLALDEVAVQVPGAAKEVMSGVKSLAPDAEANYFQGGRQILLRLEAPAVDHVALSGRAASFAKAGYTARAVLYPESAAGRTETYMQVLTNRIAVKLQEGQNLNGLMKRYGLVLAEAVEYSPSTYILEAPGGGLTRSIEAANALYEVEGVAFATPLIARQHSRKLIPADPLFGDQHHLRNTAQFTGHVAGNDVNIVSAWDSFTGNGVTIGIVDDGLETAHEDLAANVRTDIDIDINDGDLDPNPGIGDDHGTAVAGVAAAVAQNSKGGVGAGFDASLVGIRLISAATSDAQDAQAMNHQVAPASAGDRIHISSNSWGPSDDGATLAELWPLTEAAMLNGVTNGRGGLGTIYVWAAGNGRQSADNVNFDGYASSHYTIAIGASGGDGSVSYYSEPGASMLVNTVSNDTSWGITTTDRSGSAGYSGTNYTNDFGGTSSATPLASGCIALMLEANPALTWRDVQHILANTSTQNDPTDSGWFNNGAGLHFNHAYGFGRIDAAAAIAAAQTWTNVPANDTPLSNSESVATPIPDNNPAGITRTLSLSGSAGFALEHVEVTVNITHTYRGDLAITLTSPSGTESQLATVRTADGGSNFSNYTFMTVANWGEDPNGTWTLKVSDNEPVDTGTLNSWSIQARGYEASSDPVLSVMPANRDVTYPSGTTTFDVSNTSGGTLNWTAAVTAGGTWLSIQSGDSGTDAGTITAAFTENTLGSARVGSIEVTAAGATGSPQTVTVTQTPNAPPVLSVAPANRDVLATSGTTTFDVSNTGGGTLNWTAAVASGGSWLSIQSGASGTGTGTITVAFTANTLGTERVGSVEVTAVGVTGSPQTVTVTQASSTTPILTVAPTNRNVAYASSTTTFSVSNTGGGALSWTAAVISGGSWLSIQSGSSGSGDGTITAAFTENTLSVQRVGSIEVTAVGVSGSPQTVTVTQSPDMTPILQVTPANRDVAYTSGTTSFSIENVGLGTLAWSASVSSGASWLSITSPSGGTGDSTLTLSFAANTSHSSRQGAVTVIGTGASGSPAIVTVTQAGNPAPELSVSPAVRSVGYAAGSTSYSVQNLGTNPMNWTAAVTSGGDWITIVSGASGTDDGTIVVNYTENPAGTSRTGQITVTAPGVAGSPAAVQLVQSLNPTLALSVTPSVRDANFAGGTTSFSVANTGGGVLNWTASVVAKASWLTILSGGTGTGSGDIVVQYEQNLSGATRVGQIQVLAPGAANSPTTVSVQQAGDPTPQLSLSPAAKTVSYPAGSASYSVQNLGIDPMDWTAAVTSGGDWITIASGASGTDDAIIAVNYAENPSGELRTGQITVTAPGATDSPATVQLTQVRNTTLVLSVTPTERAVGYAAGTTTFSVANPGGGTLNWTAAVVADASWLTIVSGATGTGAGDILVQYEENPSAVARAGAVQIEVSGAINSPAQVSVQQGCTPPEPPSGVSASDGTFPDRIRITWNLVAEATRYQVYRADTNSFAAASLLGWWTGTTFDDFSAVTGDPVEDTGGCQSSGNSQPVYYYWVTSVNECAESGPSSSNQGQAGSAAKTLTNSDAAYAKVLPAAPLGDGTLLQAPVDAPLFIRLRSTAPIDPDSVSGRVTGVGVDTDLVFWLPVGDGSTGDGWAAVWPADIWPAGTVLTMTAAAKTDSGEDVGPVAYQFVTTVRGVAEAVGQPGYGDFDASGLDLSVESNDAVVVALALTEEEPPPMAQGVGPVYRLGPDEVFTVPQRVWLPIPEEYGVDELDFYFYQPVGDNSGWYAADLVEAWVVQDSLAQLEVDGVTYLGFLTRHGGTVQLGVPDAPDPPDAAGLGNILLLAAASLSLMVARRGRSTGRAND
jgi:subtilisin-like proprotein convertase family protein